VPLLARGSRFGSPHEVLDLLQREHAILVSIHRLKDPLVSRLKLQQGSSPSPAARAPSQCPLRSESDRSVALPQSVAMCQNRTFAEWRHRRHCVEWDTVLEILARIDRICLDSFLNFHQLIFPCCCVGGSV
jgi:hypothetical protein